MLYFLAGNVDLDCILGIILLDAAIGMKILNFEGKSRSIVISCVLLVSWTLLNEEYIRNLSLDILRKYLLQLPEASFPLKGTIASPFCLTGGGVTYQMSATEGTWAAQREFVSLRRRNMWGINNC